MEQVSTNQMHYLLDALPVIQQTVSKCQSECQCK